jgi:hypothetical protein
MSKPAPDDRWALALKQWKKNSQPRDYPLKGNCINPGATKEDADLSTPSSDSTSYHR